MKKQLSILSAHALTKTLHALKKNGSQYPGYFAMEKMDTNILNEIRYPKLVIAVTGSSGKGTTCGLIEHALKLAGYTVAFNNSGSNCTYGITSLILQNTDIHGNFTKDVLLLECDERHLKYVFEDHKPTHLVITNITRDQPARNGTPEIVFNDVLKAVGPDTTLILNHDDPMTLRATLKYPKYVTFHLGKMKDDFTKPRLQDVDFAYCPNCHTKLTYSYYHYGHIGEFKCSHCGYGSSKPDYAATKLDLNKKEMYIEKDKISLNYDAIYTAYAYLTAYTLLRSIGLDKEIILKLFNDDPISTKRGKTLQFGERSITMLETKNENNLSYYQSIRYIVNAPGKKSILLGFNDVSLRHPHHDVSWLYDIDFELLNDSSIAKIYCIGKFAYDVKARLTLAGIPESKIELVTDVFTLPERLNTSEGQIYTMVCFNLTTKLKKIFGGESHEN